MKSMPTTTKSPVLLWEEKRAEKYFRIQAFYWLFIFRHRKGKFLIFKKLAVPKTVLRKKHFCGILIEAENNITYIKKG